MEPKFVDWPKGEICDVVMLSNSATRDIFEMTQSAINSLHNSEINNTFRITLVESSFNAPKYTGVFQTINFDQAEFNYNHALILGFNALPSDCVWVYVSNNDILAKPNWYSTMRYYIDMFSLDSASPFSPEMQFGPRTEAQQMLFSYPQHSIVVGYQAVLYFCGWGWMMRKSLLDILRPYALPCSLKFWHNDDFLGHCLAKIEKKHACVTESHVVHFGQRSYSLIPQEKMHSWTTGLYPELIKKLQEME